MEEQKGRPYLGPRADYSAIGTAVGQAFAAPIAAALQERDQQKKVNQEKFKVNEVLSMSVPGGLSKSGKVAAQAALDHYQSLTFEAGSSTRKPSAESQREIAQARQSYTDILAQEEAKGKMYADLFAEQKASSSAQRDQNIESLNDWYYSTIDEPVEVRGGVVYIGETPYSESKYGMTNLDNIPTMNRSVEEEIGLLSDVMGTTLYDDAMKSMNDAFYDIEVVNKGGQTRAIGFKDQEFNDSFVEKYNYKLATEGATFRAIAAEHQQSKYNATGEVTLEDLNKAEKSHAIDQAFEEVDGVRITKIASIPADATGPEDVVFSVSDEDLKEAGFTGDKITELREAVAMHAFRSRQAVRDKFASVNPELERGIAAYNADTGQGGLSYITGKTDVGAPVVEDGIIQVRAAEFFRPFDIDGIAHEVEQIHFNDQGQVVGIKVSEKARQKSIIDAIEQARGANNAERLAILQAALEQNEYTSGVLTPETDKEEFNEIVAAMSQPGGTRTQNLPGLGEIRATVLQDLRRGQAAPSTSTFPEFGTPRTTTEDTPQADTPPATTQSATTPSTETQATEAGAAGTATPEAEATQTAEQTATQPAAQPAAQPATQPAAQPAADATPGPVAESGTEPVSRVDQAVSTGDIDVATAEEAKQQVEDIKQQAATETGVTFVDEDAPADEDVPVEGASAQDILSLKLSIAKSGGDQLLDRRSKRAYNKDLRRAERQLEAGKVDEARETINGIADKLANDSYPVSRAARRDAKRLAKQAALADAVGTEQTTEEPQGEPYTLPKPEGKDKTRNQLYSEGEYEVNLTSKDSQTVTDEFGNELVELDGLTLRNEKQGTSMSIEGKVVADESRLSTRVYDSRQIKEGSEFVGTYYWNVARALKGEGVNMKIDAPDIFQRGSGVSPQDTTVSISHEVINGTIDNGELFLGTVKHVTDYPDAGKTVLDVTVDEQGQITARGTSWSDGDTGQRSPVKDRAGQMFPYEPTTEAGKRYLESRTNGGINFEYVYNPADEDPINPNIAMSSAFRGKTTGVLTLFDGGEEMAVIQDMVLEEDAQELRGNIDENKDKLNGTIVLPSGESFTVRVDASMTLTIDGKKVQQFDRLYGPDVDAEPMVASDELMYVLSMAGDVFFPNIETERFLEELDRIN